MIWAFIVTESHRQALYDGLFWTPEERTHTRMFHVSVCLFYIKGEKLLSKMCLSHHDAFKLILVLFLYWSLRISDPKVQTTSVLDWEMAERTTVLGVSRWENVNQVPRTSSFWKQVSGSGIHLHGTTIQRHMGPDFLEQAWQGPKMGCSNPTLGNPSHSVLFF